MTTLTEPTQDILAAACEVTGVYDLSETELSQVVTNCKRQALGAVEASWWVKALAHELRVVEGQRGAPATSQGPPAASEPVRLTSPTGPTQTLAPEDEISDDEVKNLFQRFKALFARSG